MPKGSIRIGRSSTLINTGAGSAGAAHRAPARARALCGAWPGLYIWKSKRTSFQPLLNFSLTQLTGISSFAKFAMKRYVN